MDFDLLLTIALEVILPVIIMAGLGYVLGRFRVLEPEPVAKLYMSVFAPALAFVKLTEAQLSGADFGRVFAFCFIAVVVLFAVARFASVFLGHDRGMRGAFANSVIMYNSANYGLPVQELAFPGLGSVIQPIVLMAQTLACFSLGTFNAASNSPSLWATLKRVLALPLTWALVLGALFRVGGITGKEISDAVPMLWTPLEYFQRALVPVALLSLGVQLSRVRIRGKVRNISVATALRLLLGPLVGLGIGVLLGLRGDLLAVLVVSLSFPSAVFSSVLATEFRNHAEYAAAAVFVSTVVSIVTVTMTIYLARVYLLP